MKQHGMKFLDNRKTDILTRNITRDREREPSQLYQESRSILAEDRTILSVQIERQNTIKAGNDSRNKGEDRKYIEVLKPSQSETDRETRVKKINKEEAEICTTL